jgi:CHASE2 domain-containing sensor protein
MLSTLRKKRLSALRNKGLRYWISALLVLLLSFFGAPYLYGIVHLAPARAQFFQYLLDRRPLFPRFVKVVLIEDDDYWDGALAGRRPIKRDYLAKLVEKLAAANAQIIALDFDLRLPNPEASTLKIPLEYRAETARLMASILSAAESSKKIVLPRTIRYGKEFYELDPDIFTTFGVCTRPDEKGRWKNPGSSEFAIPDKVKENITCGYIALPDDILIIPGLLRLDDDSYIDSFALAIVRSVNPDEAASTIGPQISYGSFISEHKLHDYNAAFSAHDVLNSEDRELEKKLGGKTVVVGAGWSRDAYHRGPQGDLHDTAIGKIVGAYVHANYVEAFLDSRTFPSVSPVWARAVEILFGILAMLLFASVESFWLQLATVAGLTVILTFVQRIALHELGVFFDAFIPVLALWLHSLYDRLVGVHSGAQVQR